MLSLQDKSKNGRAMSSLLHSKIDFQERTSSHLVLVEVDFMEIRMSLSNGKERPT